MPSEPARLGEEPACRDAEPRKRLAGTLEEHLRLNSRQSKYMGRARLAGIAMTAIVAILAAAYLLLPAAVWVVVRALTLTLNACVWLAASLSSGADGWTIAATVGRAVADALT